MLPQKQNFFSKTLRYAIKLDELYCVAKSFQNWSQLFLRTNRGNVPKFVLLKRTVHVRRVAAFVCRNLVEIYGCVIAVID